jgi:hypothetical protein
MDVEMLEEEDWEHKVWTEKGSGRGGVIAFAKKGFVVPPKPLIKEKLRELGFRQLVR